MRRLLLSISVVTLGLAVWALPSLAAHHRSSATGAKGARATGRRAAVASQAPFFQASLAPSVPADPMIDGAKPGAAPWILDTGRVDIAAGGQTTVDLTGFVIPGKGVGPVKTLSASLFCGGATKPAATTGQAALSASGDAHLSARLSLPATCLAPTVLVHPNGATGSYVAASGWAR